MTQHLLRLFGILLLLVTLAGCGSDSGMSQSVSPNTALFDPSTGEVPLPNVLATATARDPITQYTDPVTGAVGVRPANRPMNPLEALAYVNRYEVGGTNAVAGVNAPIYLRFARPLQPATVNGNNIKVFRIGADSAAPSATENTPLRFSDVTGTFSFSYTAGRSDVSLFPRFPLQPGSRYVYLVTNRVKDAATGGSVSSSVYFSALKSELPLLGPFAPLEQIRGNTLDGSGNVLFSGYAKVMNDLTAAPSVTSVSSRDQIALFGRFNTTAAGFVATDPADPVGSLVSVESALRAFAAGSDLPGGLPGKTWLGAGLNAATVTATLAPAAYWSAVLAGTGIPAVAPASVGAVITGSIASADISMNPVVARGNPVMNQNVAFGSYSAASAVLLPFRDAGTGRLTGFYYSNRQIPFVYFAPSGTAPAGGWPLAIYQHAINGSKEQAIAVAGTLTAAGYAVVAIDLPLHGALALPGHLTGTVWGEDFIALGAPLAARTNMQQAAFNLDRLELVVATPSFNPAFAGHGFAALGANAPNPGLKPKYVGVSLGAIVGAYYLAGNTTLSATAGTPPYSQATLDADMKGLLSVPGARIAYLLRDSVDFGPSINAGLARAGIPSGSPTYEKFFQLTQSVFDPVDPATMTTPLPDLRTASALPSRLSGRVLIQEATSTAFDANGRPTNGDLVIPNWSTRYLGDALGGRGALGTPEAFAVAPGFDQLSYLSGRVPVPFMTTVSGGAVVPKAAPAAGDAGAAGPREGYFQFDQPDVSHGFLIDPVTSPQSFLLGQRQMFYFVRTGLVIDPTVVSASLPKGSRTLPSLPLYRVIPAPAARLFAAPS
ncbi:Ig-like domain-containing protein [Geomonas azotofigens]|uniref:Ig-like domain-containing protein n=1 Tax=Geomonas azotofigens TaxID=2843196 RepID=UPI001C103AFE|nr:Ig-like domain-containing protein [Geomonas azotofigens]MBU5615133.1 Ig-like domain-containing protein [Geomonas azotofigens]